MATQKRRAEQNLNNTDEDTRAQAEAEADADADADAEQAALMLNVDDHLVALPGVRRALISLTGKAWERSLLWRLDWVNFLFVSFSSSLSLPFPLFTPCHPISI